MDIEPLFERPRQEPAPYFWGIQAARKDLMTALFFLFNLAFSIGFSCCCSNSAISGDGFQNLLYFALVVVT